MAEGETVEVGTPIIRIQDATDSPAEPVETPPAQPLVEPDEAPGHGPSAALRQAEGTDPVVTGNVQDDLGEVPVSTPDSVRLDAGRLRGQGRLDQPPSAALDRHRFGGGARDRPGARVLRHGDAGLPAHRRRHPVRAGLGQPFGRAAAAARTARPEVESGRPPLAKPPVRRIARDLGIDLTQVTGTGPGGTITRRTCVTAPRAGVRTTGDRRVQLKGIRREMFRSMTASLNVPQATAFVRGGRHRHDGTASRPSSARREFAGLRISPLLVFAKAACLAIARNPEINSSFDEATEEIVLHGDVNLGIAAATPRGLVVPNIKRADRMNLLELAQSLNEMVAVAKQGRVQPGRPEPRHVHDHQRRRLRRGRWHADHEPGRGGDHVPRHRPAQAVGDGHRGGRAHRDPLGLHGRASPSTTAWWTARWARSSSPTSPRS